MNHYKEHDHKVVSDRIQAISNIKWIVSYDNVKEIKELYENCSKKEYSFKHTAYSSREGKEVLFFSPDLKQPAVKDWNPLKFSFDSNHKTMNRIAYRQHAI